MLYEPHPVTSSKCNYNYNYRCTTVHYNNYKSSHTLEDVCACVWLCMCLNLFWGSVYVQLWLTPPRCSCWQHRSAALADAHTFSLCSGLVIHIYRAGRANELNWWPPFIVDLSHELLFTLERKQERMRGSEDVGEDEVWEEEDSTLTWM